MKAAVLNSLNGKFAIEEILIDEPQGREVLVQVKACGLCHSDLHVAESEWGVPLPAVLGHELAGIVTGLGPDAREFQVGDHVVGSLIRYCGRCGPCQAARTYQCEHPEESLRGAGDAPRLTNPQGAPVTAGYGTAAFAEYALVHEHQLVKVPDALPFPQACLLGCSTVTGAGAILNTAGVKPGETVAVIGIGGVGLNAISGARLAGAGRIIAIDNQPAKESLARKFGATDFIDAAQADAVAGVIGLTGKGVDHAFEVIGRIDTSEQAIRMVRVGGAAYLIGMPKPGTLLSIDVLSNIIARQITLKGVMMGSTNVKHDIPIYADLYLQGRFNLDDLVSQEINLSQINDAYDDMKTGTIARSVITSF